MTSAHLADRERRQYRRLVSLARHVPAGERDALPVRDLVFVLHDVLVDAYRPDREVEARHTGWWSRVEAAVGTALTRQQLDQQLFLLGAYATVAAVELALDEPERTLVVERFLATAKGTLRLRRSRPGRWHIRRALDAYRAATPEEGGSFLHVGGVFTASCAAVSAAPDAVEAAADVLADVAIDAFYDAAAGTANAVTTWRIVA